MEEKNESILTSIKKMLGVAEEYEVVDSDIIVFINTAFSTLLDLGIGPKAGFAIMDKESKWSDYIEDWLQFNDVKTYIYLKVKLVFDPPQSSSVASSYASTVKELEWRICNRKDREGGDENE